MFECELFPNWMVVLCSPTFAGSRQVKADPLSPPYPPQPRLSNLINPTNPNKKSHKSKSKLHKSRKMLPAEFLPVWYFCPKKVDIRHKSSRTAGPGHNFEGCRHQRVWWQKELVEQKVPTGLIKNTLGSWLQFGHFAGLFSNGHLN